MTILKGWINAVLLVAVVMVSVSTINAGIVVGNVGTDEGTKPCVNGTEPNKDIDWGVIVGNLGGIIVGQFVGPIIVGEPAEDCGIIVGQ